MNAAPRVSVVLPVRDGGRPFEAALRSLRKQTEKDWECLIVDDGSTDGSMGLAESFARLDPRFKVLRNAGKPGLVRALNLGVERASGRWIARMDADDVCHPRRIELQADRLERAPHVDLVSCRVKHFGESVTGGVREYERWLNGLLDHEAISKNFFVESPFPHPSVMTSREAVQAAGGYRDDDRPEDYDLWLRMFLRGMRFEKLPQTLLFWRDHPNRLSRADPRYDPARFRAARLHYFFQWSADPARRHHIWGCGRTGRKWANALARKGYRLAGAVDLSLAKIGKGLAGVEIRFLTELDFQPGDLVLCTVGVWGVRDRVRQWLNALGLVEGRDYLCVA